MENAVCFFEIAARDVAAAGSFYERLFGWKTSAFEDESYLLVRTSSDDDAVLRGGLRKSTEGDGVGTTMFVMVPSVDEAIQQAEALGGALRSAKTAIGRLGWVATITDPEGNQLGLFEPAPEDTEGKA